MNTAFRILDTMVDLADTFPRTFAAVGLLVGALALGLAVAS
jgi:hypothetical protein